MHHSKEEWEKPTPFGATGLYPEGKLRESDEGEIKFGVTHDPATGKVIIDFGTPVAWVGMSAAQAGDLGRCLMKHARDCRVIKSDARSEREAETHGKTTPDR